MAFIAGFNKSSILRLKLTFKELGQRASKVIIIIFDLLKIFFDNAVETKIHVYIIF